VNSLGYGSIRWTVDTLGWEGTRGGQSVATVSARVKAALRPGAIVLMHVGSAPDGSTLDANALPGIIAELRARGYSFVTLSAFTEAVQSRDNVIVA
jgi:peptidoglycan/xylan/chitin deacetylase (PgdA/CDA1 family)